MNRRIATWAVVALATLGLTACGGAPSPPAEPPANSAPAEPAPSPDPTTAAPEPEPAPSEQSLTEACLEPNAKILEAQAELAAAYAALSAADGNDPQATVDALVEVADYFGKLAEASSHPDVKQALTGIQEGYQKFSDIMRKVLIDEDLSAAADAATVMADLQKALDDFTKLCTP